MISFQPTYEELKLIDSNDEKYIFPGFQPTYEELKRQELKNALVRDAGFQPTYEELKQDNSFMPLPLSISAFPAYL